MAEFEIKDGVAIIPEGTEHIDLYKGIDGLNGLTTIVIPKSVTSIGQGAFNFCSNLQEITVSSENLLENMEIPEGVKVIIAS